MKYATSLCCYLLLWNLNSSFLQAQNSWDRLQVSVTLSGHILFGLGYEHGFDQSHAIHLNVFPLILPGKGFPFAMSAGYNYYWDTAPWQAKLGVDVAAIISPPDTVKRRILPLIMITPEVGYVYKKNNYFGTEFWLAHFLEPTNHKWPLIPIGWKFDYGYKM